MRPLPLVFAALLAFAAAPVRAQWAADPAVDLTVAGGPGVQTQPKIALAPGDGFYVSWFGEPGYSVYLQRLDAFGVPQWAPGGVLVAARALTSTQDYGLTADPEGNAILAFRSADGTRVAAQKVPRDGDLL